MLVDPVVGLSPLLLHAEPSVRAYLRATANGRPLVIDYYASRRGALTVGDLTVGFPRRNLEPRYIEIQAIEDVPVLVERSLLSLLVGATLRLGGLPFARHLFLALSRPEQWIEFVERHPTRRR